MRYSLAHSLDGRWFRLADEDFDTLQSAVFAACILAEDEGGEYCVVDHEVRDAVAFVRLAADGFGCEVAYNHAYVGADPLSTPLN